MKESFTYDFCEITVYDHFVVFEINEGVNITPDHNYALMNVKESFFLEKPFVYISHRVNSYSVDPQIYYETTRIDTLKGFAVVSNNYLAKKNAQIEKRFFNKPFEIFSTLEEAISWAKAII